MVTLSSYKQYYYPADATAVAADIAVDKTAYVNGGKVTGTGVYSPAMMKFDGSTGYYSKTGITTSGNAITAVLRLTTGPFTADNQVPLYIYKSYATLLIAVVDSDAANNAGKLWIRVQSNTGTTICQLYSNSDVDNNTLSMIFFQYDATAGTAVLRINGVDEDNTGAVGRTLTTGTLDTGVATQVGIGATTSATAKFQGQLGYVGVRFTNTPIWSDFMDASGNPKPLDEATWTEWGGQPLFWNPYGEMTNNIGSAGDMTKNGTIDVAYGTPARETIPAYTPAMMEFDGTTGYYSSTSTYAGNKGTLFGKLNFAKKNNGIGQYVVRTSGAFPRMAVILTDNDHALTADRNTLNFIVWNSSGTIITRLYSTEGVDLTNQDLVFFASYDGDLGLATFIINGQDGDSITHPNRIAPTTATLSTGSGEFTVGATYTPSHFADGRIGAIGYRDAYLTNWSDFMHIDGALKPLDESTWTEWGAQPMFWHEAAKMDENKGSAGAMTKNGSITLASAIP